MSGSHLNAAPCPHCGQVHADGAVVCAALRPANPFNNAMLDTLPGEPVAAPRSSPSVDFIDPLIGSIIEGRYRILLPIAKGGMGAVYKAKHLQLNNLVAMKVMLRPEARLDQERFKREAQLASTVHHPNTVYIADFGLLPDGEPFLVMEYLEGRTLRSLVAEGPLDVLRACGIALQVVSGVLAIHDKGIIHRDLKPANILLLNQSGNADFVKIVDFGVAKLRDVGPEPKLAQGLLIRQAAAARQPDELTQAGALVGTLAYMAPEQLLGEPADARSDQYAIGCLLYAMLVGEIPFRSPDSTEEDLLLKLSQVPESPRARLPGAHISEGLNQAVMRCLATNPGDRFPALDELLQVLQQELQKLQAERSGISSAAPLPAPLPASPAAQPAQRKPARLTRGKLLLGLPLIVLAALGAYRLIHLRWGADRALAPGAMAELRQRAIRELLATQHSSVARERALAMAALAEAFDGRLLPVLAKGLQDSDPGVDSEAARGLGSLGDSRAVDPLLAATAPGRPQDARLAAASALRTLGDERGQKLLSSALHTSNPTERLQAALVLCEQDAAALEQLRVLLASGSLLGQSTLRVLSCLAAGGDETAADLLAARLRSGPPPERLWAAAHLAEIADPRGTLMLRELAGRPGPMQLAAARLLAAQGADPETTALLRRVARSAQSEPPAQALAIEGVGLSGDGVDAVWLAQLLAGAHDASVRIASAGAIVRLSRSDPGLMSEAVFAWVESAVHDPSWSVRQAAVATLRDLPAPRALALIAGALADHDAKVRLSAVRALGHRQEWAAVIALRERLQDADPEIQREAVRSLGRQARALQQRGLVHQVEQIVGWLRLTSQSTLLEVSVQALGELLHLGFSDARAALLLIADKAQLQVRRLVVEQLRDDPSILVTMLADKAFEIRFLAASLLAQQHRDDHGVALLVEGLQKEAETATQAYAALEYLGRNVAAPIDWRRILRGGPLPERLSLVRLCASLPPQMALQLLGIAATDSDELVRAAVVMALDQMAAERSLAIPPFLRRLLADRSLTVRLPAAALYDRLTREPAPVPAPAPAGPTAGRAETALLPNGSVPDGSAPADARPDLSPPTVAASAPSPSPSPSPASGTLLLVAKQKIFFRLDQRPWQLSSSEPIALLPARHNLVTLTGEQVIEIAPGQLTTVTVPESPIESQGYRAREAFLRNNLPAATKSFERSRALCSRGLKRELPCAELIFEATVRLGQLYEQQDRLTDAMGEYQQAMQTGAPVKSQLDLLAIAQKGFLRLQPRMGAVILPLQAHARCAEVTQWLLPGMHLVVVNGKSQRITIKAGESQRVGACLSPI